MRTFKLCMILLIIIIIGALSFDYALNKTVDELSKKVEKLEYAVTSENWNESEKQLDIIQDSWKRSEKWLTTLVDHREMDEIKMTLAKLSQYLHYKKKPEFMAESATLKLLIEHLASKEKVTLSNLL